MEHPPRAQAEPASLPSTSVSNNVMPNVVFREIHKSAFLKKHFPERPPGFPRRRDRVFVVFCVHDDNEAFLEIYQDEKLAQTHKPDWFTSLANALHVSPSICGYVDECVFAVTLTSQVVRLSAPTWDGMMDWVNTISNKLRELRVLSPKENVYSKMPEPKLHLLPTRDPNSPLPLPPEGEESAIFLGVEPVHGEAPAAEASELVRHQRSSESNERRSHRSNQPRVDIAAAYVETNIHPSRIEIHLRADRIPEVPEGSSPEEEPESYIQPVSNVEVVSNKPRVRLSRAVSVPESPVPHSSYLVPSAPAESNITVITVEVSASRGSHSASEVGFFNFQITDEVITTDPDMEDVFFTPPATPKPKISNVPEVIDSFSNETYYEHVFFPNPPELQPEVKNNFAPSNTTEIRVVGDSRHVSNVSIASESSSHAEGLSTKVEEGENVKSVVVSQSPLSEGPSISGESDTAEAGASMSLQIQAKLEKVNSTGLIPRVPSKSSKHDVSRKVSHGSKEPVPGEGSSAELPPSKEVTESKRITERVDMKLPGGSPPYSVVKKVSKIKIADATVVPETSNAQMLSPVPPRRRINECKIQRSQSDKKPEVLPRTTSNKSSVEVPKPSSSSEPKNINVDPAKQRNGLDVKLPAPSVSNNRFQNETPTPSTSSDSEKKERVNSNNNVDSEPLTASVQPTVGVLNVQDIPLIGGHQRRRRRSSSSDATPALNAPPTRGISGADRIRVNLPGLTVALPAVPQRSEADQNSQVNAVSQNISRLTLREQQVLQLRREMSHPGGVRLQLRRKDCVGSIALVDVLGGVWVAGWKQREHPMLYNALHIGDQLVSVSEVLVRSSADAQKLIRSSSSLYIEFIIRRVPFGKVLALHRSSEGQALGLVQEGNTAEVKDVLPNSVAARQGLPAKTPSCDGLSLTNWYLTEINGRPLNLFFKDNEVRDRLNSVGKEISILVQPHDFMKQIKKHLKSIRSYKDYIVQ